MKKLLTDTIIHTVRRSHEGQDGLERNDPANTAVMEEPANTFDALMDMENMKGVFQNRFPSLVPHGSAIRNCAISYSHYKRYLKPVSRHKSFLAVCYQLEVMHKDGDCLTNHTLYAKAYLGGLSRYIFEQCVDPANPNQPGIRHLPELDMVVWTFPMDPALPQLPEMIDSARVIRHLPFNRMPHGWDCPGAIIGVTHHVIHYRPECRCTIRYDLQRESGNPQQTLCLFGKTFRDSGEEIFERMIALWNISQQYPECLRVPQPLAYNPQLKTIWQMGVPGIPLRHTLTTDFWHANLESVARGLATIHTSGLNSSETITVQGLFSEFQKKVEKLTQVFPAGKKTLQALSQQLENWPASSQPATQQLIHGDFHIDQLLVHDGQVIFFDFDECAHGNPHQDLANFLVDLHFHDIPPAMHMDLACTFIESYRRHVPWKVVPEWLEWHACIQFINKLYRAYVQRHSNFEHHFHRLHTVFEQRFIDNWKVGASK